MAKTRSLRRIKAQITIDYKTESVLIRNLILRDSEVSVHVSNFGKQQYHSNSPAKKMEDLIKQVYDTKKGGEVRR